MDEDLEAKRTEAEKQNLKLAKIVNAYCSEMGDADQGVERPGINTKGN